MAMRPCSRCLENSWKFEKLPDGWARATCQMCAATVEFEAKKKLAEGDPCRHCKEPLVWKARKPLGQKAMRAPFHYCKWLKCPKCRATYLSTSGSGDGLKKKCVTKKETAGE